MKKYIISLQSDGTWNASSKARDDIEQIACAGDFTRIVFHGNKTVSGGVASLLALIRDAFSNWSNLADEVEDSSLVLIQYPHYPLKTALLIRRLIPSIRRRKNVRFAALVHDLNSVRGTFGWAARYSDKKLLSRFDAVICHNDSMKRYLCEHGIDEGRLVPLGLFDYCTEAPLRKHHLSDGIALAGNLSPEKCGYISEMLAALDGRLPLHLYGNGFDENVSYSSVTHHGSFPPEELPGVIEGAFGLVWDGKSIDTCSGQFGEYLKINDPHKVSLYLASGMPVIIWSQSALAEYITSNGLGMTVDSIRDIPDKLSAVSESDYERFCKNAEREAARLRGGSFFTDAVDSVVSLLS